jgi:hypothetical protein
MQKGEFYKALDDFRVCFAGAADVVCLCESERERENASAAAAASFFISHSALFFSLCKIFYTQRQ